MSRKRAAGKNNNKNNNNKNNNIRLAPSRLPFSFTSSLFVRSPRMRDHPSATKSDYVNDPAPGTSPMPNPRSSHTGLFQENL